ncbi:beta-glucanosyltransferase gel2 [Niveomyces insectorum RCEF 264]|uniref:1,3-beta-glucanosyltransferase n=1 Tax=Niveomyces insectorum RCEF 264 TaxID=1081102 RepID=A0A167TTP4_9HYPO|nr:beta-glucanosyltransferase gel2 [Niveomyces insectorum RCEF 264]
MFLSATLVALGATLAAAVPSLVVQGSDFVNPSTGDRFQVVGVAYQPGGSAGYQPAAGFDPLSDGTKCLRDAALMQILGINAIRVYNLDPDLNHDECASIFNAAGMYMMIDVNSPLVGESLDAGAPWTTYTSKYLNRTFAVVEAFRHYPNTLLSFSGNEVINDMNSATLDPQYIRAVTRDIKDYIAKHADRPIPVGYSAADVRSVLFDSWNYFQCEEPGVKSDSSRVDVFALNSYSWCGDSSYTTSTYDTLVDGFKGTSVPVFFSEYGCNKPAPRVFTEVGTIYGSEMMSVFSGGVVYEYANEVSAFGLVNISSDGSVDILPDYYTLQAQYSKVDFKSVQSTKADGTAAKPPVCSAKLIANATAFAANFTLPSLPPGAAAILAHGVSPLPSGKIVPISDYTVKTPVRNPNGTDVTNLAVKPLANNAINTPGTNSASSSASSSGGGGDSGSGSGSGSGKKNAGLGRADLMWTPAVALCVVLPSLFALFL